MTPLFIWNDQLGPFFWLQAHAFEGVLLNELDPAGDGVKLRTCTVNTSFLTSCPLLPDRPSPWLFTSLFSEIDKSLGIIKDLLGYKTFCRKILCGCHDQQSAFSALDRVIMNWTELYQGLAPAWWRTTTYFDKFPIVLSHLSLHTDGCWCRAKLRFLACNANSRQIRIMEYFGLILKSF